MSRAGDAIRAYGEKTKRHVARYTYSEEAGGTVEMCDLLRGDRCDITAAYRHAADIADEEQEK